MFKSKEVEVYGDRDSLAMTVSWYSPKAFFFLFFTAFWNVFLVVWFTMAFIGGAPLIFKLFPIIHVAVGLWLIYYTLCMFMNKTLIDVVDDYLMIEHKPIPWWRGNKEIPLQEIQQLYVKEVKKSGKNGVQFTYQLRAKMKTTGDQELINIDNLSSQQLLEIEKHLEDFAGIQDQPIAGEYGKEGRSNLPPVKGPRKNEGSFPESILSDVYTSLEGNWVTLKGEELKIISISQFDWKDGNSDKLFQLIRTDQTEQLIYMEQNKALLNAYGESSLHLAEANALDFSTEDVPSTLEFKGKQYSIHNYKSGDHFVSGTQHWMEVEHWRYLSDDQQSYLRIVNNKGLLQYYQGQKIALADFSETLDLNAPPERQIDYDDRKWKDEDLV